MPNVWLVLFHPVLAQLAIPLDFHSETRLDHSYQRLIFIEHLLCTKYVTCIVSLDLHTSLEILESEIIIVHCELLGGHSHLYLLSDL